MINAKILFGVMTAAFVLAEIEPFQLSDFHNAGWAICLCAYGTLASQTNLALQRKVKPIMILGEMLVSPIVGIVSYSIIAKVSDDPHYILGGCGLAGFVGSAFLRPALRKIWPDIYSDQEPKK